MQHEEPHQDHNASSPRQMPSTEQSQSYAFGHKMIISIGGFVVLIALIAVNGGFSKETSEQFPQTIDKKQKIVNHLGQSPQMPAILKKIQEPTVTMSSINPPPMLPEPIYSEYKINHTKQKQEPTPQERKITSSVLGYTSKTTQNASHTPKKTQEDETFLKDTAKASLIPDRNFFITKGTSINCVLETAMSSDVAGMTSCRIAQDVYSTSGKIVLLERGTKIIGQYKSGLKQGKSRLFVLWNRAETPNGVIIDLDSGGTDALGRAGHEGFIDTHFYERFSGAIMLSLLDDIGAYAVNQASNTQNGQIQLSGTAGSTSDAASIALENSINIRPTFYKNQGDHIHILVAKDLDFRGVYELKVTE